MKTILHFIFGMALLLAGLNSFGQQQHPKVVNTIADLVRQNPNDVHKSIEVLGYNSPNDGGGGIFTLATNSATPGLRFQSTVGGKVWQRVLKSNEPLTPQMFGAVVNGSTDNTVAIQNAYNALEDGQTVFFPKGDYSVTTIEIDGTKTSNFEGDTGARLIHSEDATTSMFSTGSDTNTQTLRFRNLSMDGNKANRMANWNDTPNNASLISVQTSYKKLIVDDCRFTNSVRSAIRIAGPARITDSWFHHMNPHNGTNDTHTIFAQPTTGEVQPEEMWLDIRGCVFKAEDTSIDALWSNPGGIFITESQTSSATEAVYDRVNIIGNFFYGIGCDREQNELDPIRVYNGARRVNVTHNHIDGFSFCGIGIQRTDFATVAFNTITRGENTQNGASGGTNNTFGIFIAPKAREGSTPFTGGRLGEEHWGFNIEGNTITNLHRYAITVFGGGQGRIAGNFIDTVQTNGAGVVGGIVITDGADDVIIEGNTVKNVPQNDILLSGTGGLVERISARGNWIIQGDVTKTGVGIFTHAGVQNSEIKGNFIVLNSGSAATGLSVRESTNMVVSQNWVLNANIAYDTRTASANIVWEDNWAIDCATGFRSADTTRDLRYRRNSTVAATTSLEFLDTSGPIIVEDHDHNGSTTPYAFDPGVTLTRRNNSDLPFTSRRDTNSVFEMVIYNGSSDTLALSQLAVRTVDSGGGLRAYPSTYASALRADRLVLGTDSTASGLSLMAEAGGQDIRQYLNGVEFMRLSSTGQRFLYATASTVPVLDANRDLVSSRVSTNQLDQLNDYETSEGTIEERLDSLEVVVAGDSISVDSVSVTDLNILSSDYDILATLNTGPSPDTVALTFRRTATLANDPVLGGATFGGSGNGGVIFEGTPLDNNEGYLTTSGLTADQTWTLPDGSGTVSLLERAQTFTASQTFGAAVIQPIDTMGALDVDWSTGNVFLKTTSGNHIFTFSNATAGQWVTVQVTATGAHTITWPTVTWRGGVTPTQTASATDFYTFFFNGTKYYGEASQDYAE